MHKKHLALSSHADTHSCSASSHGISSKICRFCSALTKEFIVCVFGSQKIVVKVDVQDDKEKQKAMNAVSALQGIASSSFSFRLVSVERLLSLSGRRDSFFQGSTPSRWT